MAVAIYAISYEDTGVILSYCQLTQRDLSAKGAAQALLDQLVPDKLTVSLSTVGGPAIEIDPSHLHVDEVEITGDFEAFKRAPYSFMVDLTDPAKKPGDGQKKNAVILTAPYGTPTLTHGSPGSLQVTFAMPVAADTRLFAIIDGHEIPATVTVPTPIINFSFSSAVNTVHSVVFGTRGVQPFVGLMKAT